MNLGVIIRLLGILVLVVGATMAAPLAWSVYFGEEEAKWAFLKSMGVSAALGSAAIGFTRRRAGTLFRKEALAVVGLGWLLTAFVGSLPYLFSGTLSHPADAYFEAMSGFTTTGSTVLTEIESRSRSILFWRSLTHWLGGMGIIVLFIAVLPYLGAGGKHLYRTEAPGPLPESLRPRIRQTAALLWKIYIAMTVAETVALMLCGMSFYEALCHTFGTLATGGFSTRSASIAAFDSVAVDLVIIFFMVLAGLNFSLHARLWDGDWRAYGRDPECKAYLGVLGIATLAVTFSIWSSGVYGGIGPALRHGAFQVVSIMTTTGYCTADFNRWPPVCKAILVFLMFVGACAGSTGGGFKVIRWLTLLKGARLQIERVYRPRTVRRARIGSKVLDNELLAANVTFLGIGFGVFVLASIAMAAMGLDLVTAFSSVAATLNNIGPGLGRVGAVENYAFLPVGGKVLLSLCMVMGRLELYSILVLLAPAFWRAQ